MNHLVAVWSVVLILALSGCAIASYSVGRDFQTTHLSKVKKGETTAEEVRQWFGEPFSKKINSENEETWHYMYTNSSASAQSLLFVVNVQSDVQQKSMEVLLKNGVVVNYALTESSPMIRPEPVVNNTD